MARSKTARGFDKLYKATRSGERKSKKFATISMSDGTKFKRRNANQFGDADGNNVYTENRVNRTDKYTHSGKVIAKRGTTIRSKNALTSDKRYKATRSGERKSKKFATINMADGSKFKRRNANQFGSADGNNVYTENRKNRTDKYTHSGKVIAQRGANISGFNYSIGGL